MATSDRGGRYFGSRQSPSKSKSFESKREATAKVIKMKMWGSGAKSGGSSLPIDKSKNPLSDSFSNSSSSAQSLSESDAKLPQGMETSEWGGVDHETAVRCHCQLYWEGNNTNCHCLACPLVGIQHV
ncbi:hypothetical protein PVAP13_3NG095100 [Panicum virgatum]|uniref:Uncharacterized protein n=1 Tax=Panicum virgatum TaxID=38727 RepID=A0A8T0UIQ7_PANVG|nr:hypothetical protein PVAP13_3NG095100 [Panicum virgatum]